MGTTVITSVVGCYLQSEITVAGANNTPVPSSHNILLYEDGHAVVADFGGKAKSLIVVKLKLPLTNPFF